MKSIIVFLSLIVSLIANGAEPDYETLSKVESPYIEGDTLVIRGRIDSNVYNYFAYEAAKVAKVKYISLNSYGGQHEWALMAAEKIQELKKITIIKTDAVCASACVYLFASGTERIMEKTNWLGVHGARLGGSYATSFAGYCFVDLEDESIFMEKKKGCADFLSTWREKSLKATNAAFDTIEKAGVSPEAREYYFSLEDDPLWYEQLNVLRKPDWVVTPEEALKYGFATQVNP